jgi:hypothetical protein
MDAASVTGNATPAAEKNVTYTHPKTGKPTQMKIGT